MFGLWSHEEGDSFSFEDSDRFEEDSLCSWSTEPESICNNWRGWKRPTATNANPYYNKKQPNETIPKIPQLCELAARCVASHIPFELVEHVYPPVPEQLQLRIAYWSFPDNEEDIRLYSCLANSSADEFQRGEHLFRSRAVKDPLQIGFHLSATVCMPAAYSQRGQYNVAVAFDRRRITSCNCTCNSSAYWCSHIVAVCLHRIHLPNQVCLRAPVSESLSRLHRDQLQKFAQYLISELPQQILPTAQRILDELLSSQPSAINSVCGAPDPTAGASVNEQTSWYLDEKTLHDNIKKILIKFCVPAPIVFSDVNYLSTTAPPAASEWSSLLRPLRGREPEGMWNLLSIVREMYKRNDRNALPLLQIITDECLACDQIMLSWFNTKVALHVGVSGGGKHSSINSNVMPHACASLCDEVVTLWTLAALNPALSPQERTLFKNQFNEWHMKIIEKVEKNRSIHTNSTFQSERMTRNIASSIDVFPGFKPAIGACQLDWEDYQIPGVTYQGGGATWLAQPITCFKNSDSKTNVQVNPVNTSQVVLQHRTQHQLMTDWSTRKWRMEKKQLYLEIGFQMCQVPVSCSQDVLDGMAMAGSASGNRSSVSSEGFCENENDAPIPEEDSQEGLSCVNNFFPINRLAYKGASESSSSCSDGGRVMKHPPASESPSCDESEPGKVEPTQPETPETRRLSKDDSLSSTSDSQQSSDEYVVYYYDAKSVEKELKNEKKEGLPEPKASLPNVSGFKDPWDVLFARAEGLHAHGHYKEACILGVKLTEELLANPPDFMLDLPPVLPKGKKKKQINPASHQLSIMASNTLAKCGFLCQVLAENPEHHHLAFRVGLFGLEMPRPPATTKPLEVKLFNQESELVTLLKRIPLGDREMGIIREKAEMLWEGTLKTRGEALLPITLASYILDALSMPNGKKQPIIFLQKLFLGRESKCQLAHPTLRTLSDEALGFEAATTALGLKANVSEADHPLLCEGTRRQRGDLAVTLLFHYKDHPARVVRIMEKLLDRDVHQLTKGPLSTAYYTAHPPVKSASSAWYETSDEFEHPLIDIPSVPPVDGNFYKLEYFSSFVTAMSLRTYAGIAAPELDPCLQTKQMPMQMQQPSTSSMPNNLRSKESTRFKSKRTYPSIPNQPSEAGAHFMFELAKTVLLKAGGNSSTSLFTQATTGQSHHGPHRALHMCAFQLGLYALGLHNCVSPNWLSRTYSSHVSWITGQAMEIGAAAISFLQDTWENHLTPPEAASMADKASRGCDVNMVRAAAELALSCLPHAAALNPNEIQRAILQCKEQSDRMLEHSCLTVENAAKGGGVNPDVLFHVARCWFDLYKKAMPQGEILDDHQITLEAPLEHMTAAAVPMLTWVEGPHQGQVQGPPPPPPPQYVRPPITVPLAFFAVPRPFARPTAHHAQPQILPSQMYHVPVSYYPPPPPPTHVFSGPVQTLDISQVQGQQQAQRNQIQPSPQQVHQSVVAIATPVRAAPQQISIQQPVSATQIKYLLAAYRVGMLAMETIARRVHDDRPNAKYARNPPHGEDIKWLLRVAEKLGTQYLQQFCVCAVNSVVSPFILHDVAVEAAHYLGRNNPSLIMQHLRTSLTPLVQKCQQMYIQCLHMKLYHLSPSEHDEFINVVLSARAAFQFTPEGSQQFKEWFQSIRRSKTCQKELWAQINMHLQPTNGK